MVCCTQESTMHLKNRHYLGEMTASVKEFRAEILGSASGPQNETSESASVVRWQCNHRCMLGYLHGARRQTCVQILCVTLASTIKRECSDTCTCKRP